MTTALLFHEGSLAVAIGVQQCCFQSSGLRLPSPFGDLAWRSSGPPLVATCRESAGNSHYRVLQTISLSHARRMLYRSKPQQLRLQPTLVTSKSSILCEGVRESYRSVCFGICDRFVIGASHAHRGFHQRQRQTVSTSTTTYESTGPRRKPVS